MFAESAIDLEFFCGEFSQHFLVATAVGHSWIEFCRVLARGKEPLHILNPIARHSVAKARGWRDLDGMTPEDDVTSPRCQRVNGVTRLSLDRPMQSGEGTWEELGAINDAAYGLPADHFAPVMRRLSKEGYHLAVARRDGRALACTGVLVDGTNAEVVFVIGFSVIERQATPSGGVGTEV